MQQTLSRTVFHLAFRLLAIAALSATAAVAQDTGQALIRFETEHPAMGTLFRISCYASDSATARTAATAAFARIDSLELSMSDYREDSEVSRLSALAGTKVKMTVSQDLWTVLEYAREVSRKSEGAFDVTAGALTKLWRKAFRQQQVPDSAALAAALATVGYKYLVPEKNRAYSLRRTGTRIDLGGIAKGYAVDEAMVVLQKAGIRSALIDGGGDLLASDPPPGTMGWLIEKPVFRNDTVTTEKIALKNTAIATSGDTYRFLETNGIRHSHIIDPRSGISRQSRQLVVVKAPSCMMADAWATAMSVEVVTDAFLWLRKQGASVDILLY
ncbi:MAG: hypothetical protein RLY31_1565 [Bacteroidota bacterium]|jgi:thiamine biosynthesis lipoprotein